MKFVENAASLSEDKCKSKSTLSSCIKMTDQAQHLNGDVNSIKVTVNGNFSPRKHISSGRGHPNHNTTNTQADESTLGGGRLKFFKDGKFILELSHRKEGERTCWIPVPKKTYWPAVGTPRQESSASLSVSDDNSSVQSSPWQRDHCWKQTSPSKNISTELQFYLHLPHKSSHFIFCSKSVRRKYRKPLDPTPVQMNKASSVQINKIKTEHRTVKNLSHLTHRLWERALKHNESPPRPEILTLRKRILKELEKVSLDDLGNSKRRAKTSQVNPVPATPPPKPISSHSITAILARDKDIKTEDKERENSPSFLRTLLKSPHSDSTSDSRPSSSSSLPPPPPIVYHPTPTPAYPSPYYPWPVQYLPRAPLPLYPSASWMPLSATPWPLAGPSLSHPSLPVHPGYLKQEESGDVPLNLSKNGG